VLNAQTNTGNTGLVIGRTLGAEEVAKKVSKGSREETAGRGSQKRGRTSGPGSREPLVLVPVVYRLELAAINRNAGVRE
jgi:hypothetical protein